MIGGDGCLSGYHDSARAPHMRGVFFTGVISADGSPQTKTRFYFQGGIFSHRGAWALSIFWLIYCKLYMIVGSPMSTRHWHNVGLMLSRRHWRWTNTKATLCHASSHITARTTANTKLWPSSILMLAQRRRRCTNIKPELGHLQHSFALDRLK